MKTICFSGVGQSRKDETVGVIVGCRHGSMMGRRGRNCPPKYLST